MPGNPAHENSQGTPPPPACPRSSVHLFVASPIQNDPARRPNKMHLRTNSLHRRNNEAGCCARMPPMRCAAAQASELLEMTFLLAALPPNRRRDVRRSQPPHEGFNSSNQCVRVPILALLRTTHSWLPFQLSWNAQSVSQQPGLQIPGPGTSGCRSTRQSMCSVFKTGRRSPTLLTRFLRHAPMESGGPKTGRAWVRIPLPGP